MRHVHPWGAGKLPETPKLIRLKPPVLAMLCAVFTLAGCDLPQSAGREDQILAGANDPDASFAVETVTRANLGNYSRWPLAGNGTASGWIGHSRGPSGQIIQPGDQLNVTIWDNEESSLLKPVGQKAVPLTGLVVSQSGTIFLPYISEVYVSKMSPEEARQVIQDRLVAIAPSVQVQLEQSSGKQNSIDVVSGVAKPGPYPLLDRNTTVLGVLSVAGGVSESVENPQVRLIRDGHLYGIPLDQLMSNPSQDTTLRGGDKLFVEADDRYFVALGASGKNSRVRFPSERITALEAMALTGGMDGLRANPAAIFLLRNYSANAVRADGSGPPKQSVVFAFDLTNADGLFAAGQFPLQSGDAVVVSESPVTAARTITALLAGLLAVNAAVQ